MPRGTGAVNGEEVVWNLEDFIIVCTNCGTHDSKYHRVPYWRNSQQPYPPGKICDNCYSYLKNVGRPRPPHLEEIRMRKIMERYERGQDAARQAREGSGSDRSSSSKPRQHLPGPQPRQRRHTFPHGNAREDNHRNGRRGAAASGNNSNTERGGQSLNPAARRTHGIPRAGFDRKKIEIVVISDSDEDNRPRRNSVPNRSPATTRRTTNPRKQHEVIIISDDEGNEGRLRRQLARTQHQHTHIDEDGVARRVGSRDRRRNDSVSPQQIHSTTHTVSRSRSDRSSVDTSALTDQLAGMSLYNNNRGHRQRHVANKNNGTDRGRAPTALAPASGSAGRRLSVPSGEVITIDDSDDE